MNFTALKEKLRDQLLELWNRLQETSLFMNLREKFEGLNARVQKAIVFGALISGLLFLLSFPYAYISSSQTSLESFNENRSLIRGLLKASSSLKEPSPLPPEIMPEEMSSNITRALDEFHLVPEQIGAVTPLSDKVTNLVPDQVKQTGVSVVLKKLNLKQVVEISHRLQTLNPGTKVMGMEIKENTTSHYFDVTYRVASFSIPMASMVDSAPSGKPRKGSTPPPKAKESKDDEG